MTKIAILGDTHFGARNASTIFSKFFRRFFLEFFIPKLWENRVRTVCQLGDIFDTRKTINLLSLADAKEYFFDPLQQEGIELHVLTGNHDIFYRESLEVNSPELLLGQYPNIKLHNKPTEIFIGETSLDIIPWICKENEREISKFIKESKSDICMGHFEISGFSMYRGVASHGGLLPSTFDKYEQVWSGHYHTRSQVDNITYVGTPYELTWQDLNDPRGFHIFDLETRVLEFIPNPFVIYSRFEYDDKSLPDHALVDVAQFKDKFVKIVVTNKTDVTKFEAFTTRVMTSGAYEVKIIEDVTAFSEGSLDEQIDLEDTMTLMTNYIESVETDADKDKIKTYMKNLYVESINLEE